MAREVTIRFGKVDAYLEGDLVWKSSDPELALELNRQETLRPHGYVPNTVLAMANWAIEQVGFGEITQRIEHSGGDDGVVY